MSLSASGWYILKLAKPDIEYTCFNCHQTQISLYSSPWLKKSSACHVPQFTQVCKKKSRGQPADFSANAFQSQVSNTQRSILLRQAQSNKVLSHLRYFTHSQTDIKTEAGCRREWCHWDFHFSFQLFNDSTKELDSCCFFRWWRGKREKYLPSHMPDRSKDRQRKGEKRSSLFYDMRSLCSTQDVLKMLLVGSRLEEWSDQDPLREADHHANIHEHK